MHSFLSKVFGRKKEDKETSPTTLRPGELLDGKFEAVSPNVSPGAANFLELDNQVNGESSKDKEKDVVLSLFRAKSRPSPPQIRGRKPDTLPSLSLDFSAINGDSNVLTLEQTILSDAIIGRRRLNPMEAIVLIRACSQAIVSQGLETLGIMHPHWYSASPEVQRRLISQFIHSMEPKTPLTAFSPNSAIASPFESEIDGNPPHDIAAVLRWGLRHIRLDGDSFGTDDGWYKTFLDAEAVAEYPPKAFTEKLAPLLPSAHLDLLTATLELFSYLAAHSEANGTSGSKLSKIFGLWLLSARQVEDKDDWQTFYARWERTGRMLEHLFLSRIRDESTDQRMPVRLLELVRRYPYTHGLSSPATDLQLLPRPQFTTQCFDAFFVRIEVELPSERRKPSLKVHPLNILADAFSTKVEDGEYADLWRKITAASKDGSNPSPLSNIFADETIRFLSIIADKTPSKGAEPKSPTFSLLPVSASSPHRRSFSAGVNDRSTPVQHPKSATEPPPASAVSALTIGSDWAQFSSSGFLDTSPAIAPLVSTLFDNDVEKTLPPATPLSRKSSKRNKTASRKSVDFSAEPVKPVPEVPAEEVKEEPTSVVRATNLQIIQIDEAFIDFWSDSLLDPITANWPTFIICKFKSTLVPKLQYAPAGEDGQQKTLKWLVLEQVITVKPAPVPAPVLPASPSVSVSEAARPVSPALSTSGKNRFSFWSMSRTASSSSQSSQKGKKKEKQLNVGEMGELLEEESADQVNSTMAKVKSFSKSRRSTTEKPKDSTRKSVDVAPKSVVPTSPVEAQPPTADKDKVASVEISKTMDKGGVAIAAGAVAAVGAVAATAAIATESQPPLSEVANAETSVSEDVKAPEVHEVKAESDVVEAAQVVSPAETVEAPALETLTEPVLGPAPVAEAKEEAEPTQIPEVTPEAVSESIPQPTIEEDAVAAEVTEAALPSQVTTDTVTEAVAEPVLEEAAVGPEVVPLVEEHVAEPSAEPVVEVVPTAEVRELIDATQATQVTTETVTEAVAEPVSEVATDDVEVGQSVKDQVTEPSVQPVVEDVPIAEVRELVDTTQIPHEAVVEPVLEEAAVDTEIAQSVQDQATEPSVESVVEVVPAAEVTETVAESVREEDGVDVEVTKAAQASQVTPETPTEPVAEPLVEEAAVDAEVVGPVEDEVTEPSVEPVAEVVPTEEVRELVDVSEVSHDAVVEPVLEEVADVEVVQSVEDQATEPSVEPVAEVVQKDEVAETVAEQVREEAAVETEAIQSVEDQVTAPSVDPVVDVVPVAEVTETVTEPVSEEAVEPALEEAADDVEVIQSAEDQVTEPSVQAVAEVPTAEDAARTSQVTTETVSELVLEEAVVDTEVVQSVEEVTAPAVEPIVDVVPTTEVSELIEAPEEPHEAVAEPVLEEAADVVQPIEDQAAEPSVEPPTAEVTETVAESVPEQAAVETEAIQSVEDQVTEPSVEPVVEVAPTPEVKELIEVPHVTTETETDAVTETVLDEAAVETEVVQSLENQVIEPSVDPVVDTETVTEPVLEEAALDAEIIQSVEDQATGPSVEPLVEVVPTAEVRELIDAPEVPRVTTDIVTEAASEPVLAGVVVDESAPVQDLEAPAPDTSSAEPVTDVTPITEVEEETSASKAVEESVEPLAVEEPVVDAQTTLVHPVETLSLETPSAEPVQEISSVVETQEEPDASELHGTGTVDVAESASLEEEAIKEETEASPIPAEAVTETITEPAVEEAIADTQADHIQPIEAPAAEISSPEPTPEVVPVDDTNEETDAARLVAEVSTAALVVDSVVTRDVPVQIDETPAIEVASEPVQETLVEAQEETETAAVAEVSVPAADEVIEASEPDHETVRVVEAQEEPDITGAEEVSAPEAALEAEPIQAVVEANEGAEPKIEATEIAEPVEEGIHVALLPEHEEEALAEHSPVEPIRETPPVAEVQEETGADQTAEVGANAVSEPLEEVSILDATVQTIETHTTEGLAEPEAAPALEVEEEAKIDQSPEVGTEAASGPVDAVVEAPVEATELDFSPTEPVSEIAPVAEAEEKPATAESPEVVVEPVAELPVDSQIHTTEESILESSSVEAASEILPKEDETGVVATSEPNVESAAQSSEQDTVSTPEEDPIVAPAPENVDEDAPATEPSSTESEPTPVAVVTAEEVTEATHEPETSAALVTEPHEEEVISESEEQLVVATEPAAVEEVDDEPVSQPDEAALAHEGQNEETTRATVDGTIVIPAAESAVEAEPQEVAPAEAATVETAKDLPVDLQSEHEYVTEMATSQSPSVVAHVNEKSLEEPPVVTEDAETLGHANIVGADTQEIALSEATPVVDVTDTPIASVPNTELEVSQEDKVSLPESSISVSLEESANVQTEDSSEDVPIPEGTEIVEKTFVPETLLAVPAEEERPVESNEMDISPAEVDKVIEEVQPEDSSGVPPVVEQQNVDDAEGPFVTRELSLAETLSEPINIGSSVPTVVPIALSEESPAEALINIPPIPLVEVPSEPIEDTHVTVLVQSEDVEEIEQAKTTFDNEVSDTHTIPSAIISAGSTPGPQVSLNAVEEENTTRSLDSSEVPEDNVISQTQADEDLAHSFAVQEVDIAYDVSKDLDVEPTPEQLNVQDNDTTDASAPERHPDIVPEATEDVPVASAVDDVSLVNDSANIKIPVGEEMVEEEVVAEPKPDMVEISDASSASAVIGSSNDVVEGAINVVLEESPFSVPAEEEPHDAQVDNMIADENTAVTDHPTSTSISDNPVDIEEATADANTSILTTGIPQEETFETEQSIADEGASGQATQIEEVPEEKSVVQNTTFIEPALVTDAETPQRPEEELPSTSAYEEPLASTEVALEKVVVESSESVPSVPLQLNSEEPLKGEDQLNLSSEEAPKELAVEESTESVVLSTDKIDTPLVDHDGVVAQVLQNVKETDTELSVLLETSSDLVIEETLPDISKEGLVEGADIVDIEQSPSVVNDAPLEQTSNGGQNDSSEVAAVSEAIDDSVATVDLTSVVEPAVREPEVSAEVTSETEPVIIEEISQSLDESLQRDVLPPSESSISHEESAVEALESSPSQHEPAIEQPEVVQGTGTANVEKPITTVADSSLEKTPVEDLTGSSEEGVTPLDATVADVAENPVPVDEPLVELPDGGPSAAEATLSLESSSADASSAEQPSVVAESAEHESSVAKEELSIEESTQDEPIILPEETTVDQIAITSEQPVLVPTTTIREEETITDEPPALPVEPVVSLEPELAEELTPGQPESSSQKPHEVSEEVNDIDETDTAEAPDVPFEHPEAVSEAAIPAEDRAIEDDKAIDEVATDNAIAVEETPSARPENEDITEEPKIVEETVEAEDQVEEATVEEPEATRSEVLGEAVPEEASAVDVVPETQDVPVEGATENTIPVNEEVTREEKTTIEEGVLEEETTIEEVAAVEEEVAAVEEAESAKEVISEEANVVDVAPEEQNVAVEDTPSENVQQVSIHVDDEVVVPKEAETVDGPERVVEDAETLVEPNTVEEPESTAGSALVEAIPEEAHVIDTTVAHDIQDAPVKDAAINESSLHEPVTEESESKPEEPISVYDAVVLTEEEIVQPAVNADDHVPEEKATVEEPLSAPEELAVDVEEPKPIEEEVAHAESQDNPAEPAPVDAEKAEPIPEPELPPVDEADILHETVDDSVAVENADELVEETTIENHETNPEQPASAEIASEEVPVEATGMEESIEATVADEVQNESVEEKTTEEPETTSDDLVPADVSSKEVLLESTSVEEVINNTITGENINGHIAEMTAEEPETVPQEPTPTDVTSEAQPIELSVEDTDIPAEATTIQDTIDDTVASEHKDDPVDETTAEVAEPAEESPTTGPEHVEETETPLEEAEVPVESTIVEAPEPVSEPNPVEDNVAPTEAESVEEAIAVEDSDQHLEGETVQESELKSQDPVSVEVSEEPKEVASASVVEDEGVAVKEGAVEESEPAQVVNAVEDIVVQGDVADGDAVVEEQKAVIEETTIEASEPISEETIPVETVPEEVVPEEASALDEAIAVDDQGVPDEETIVEEPKSTPEDIVPVEAEVDTEITEAIDSVVPVVNDDAPIEETATEKDQPSPEPTSESTSTEVVVEESKAIDPADAAQEEDTPAEDITVELAEPEQEAINLDGDEVIHEEVEAVDATLSVSDLDEMLPSPSTDLSTVDPDASFATSGPFALESVMSSIGEETGDDLDDNDDPVLDIDSKVSEAEDDVLNRIGSGNGHLSELDAALSEPVAEPSDIGPSLVEKATEDSDVVENPTNGHVAEEPSVGEVSLPDAEPVVDVLRVENENGEYVDKYTTSVSTPHEENGASVVEVADTQAAEVAVDEA